MAKLNTRLSRINRYSGTEVQIPQGSAGASLLRYAFANVLTNAAERNRTEQAEEDSLRDQLTGLHNRRYVKEVVTRFHDEARREGIPHVVFMIDLDHFKQINDTYGHLAGDDVLKGFARRIKMLFDPKDERCIFSRPLDDIDRYGGEEFLGLLDGRPEAKEKALPKVMPFEDYAKQVELIRFAVQKKPFKVRVREGSKIVSSEIPVTVSIGVAIYDPRVEHVIPKGMTSLDYMITRADKALYRAKGKMPDGKTDDPNEKDARNRVCYEDESGEIKVLPRITHPFRSHKPVSSAPRSSEPKG